MVEAKVPGNEQPCSTHAGVGAGMGVCAGAGAGAVPLQSANLAPASSTNKDALVT